MAYLKDDTELAAQLVVAVNISAQNKAVDIHPSYEFRVPKGKFTVDPDCLYEQDYFKDPAGDDIATDPEWEAYVEEACRRGKLLDIICGDEQTEQESLEPAAKDLDMTN